MLRSVLVQTRPAWYSGASWGQGGRRSGAGSPGSPWLPLAPPGSSWLLLAPPGSSWLLLPSPDSSWLLLAPPRSSWLLLATTPSQGSLELLSPAFGLKGLNCAWCTKHPSLEQERQEEPEKKPRGARSGREEPGEARRNQEEPGLPFRSVINL